MTILLPSMSIQIHYAGDWAALYIDNKLEIVGDTADTEERALRMLGVEFVWDDSFMQGQSTREGVAKTLDEVKIYKDMRDFRKRQAQVLREKASELLSRAKEMETEPFEDDISLEDLEGKPPSLKRDPEQI